MMTNASHPLGQDEPSGAAGPSVLRRTLTGLLASAVLLALFWLEHEAGAGRTPLPAADRGIWRELAENGLVLVVVVLALLVLLLREFRTLAAGIGVDMPFLRTALFGLILAAAAWAGLAYRFGTFASCPVFLRDPSWTVVVVLCLATVGWCMLRTVQGPVEGSMVSLAVPVFALIYLAVPLVVLMAIRLRWGVGALLFVLVVCKLTDVGAYYAGKSIGGPRLAPVVSPNKTWSGLAGGVACAVLAASVLSRWLFPALGAPAAVVFGLVTAGAAVMGDLLESLLKREAGVKDSGRVLRGYGGLLDMVDDVLLAAPCGYVFLSAVALVQGVPTVIPR